MRRFLAIFLTLIIASTAFADDSCGYCHGNGRYRSRVATSSFGISNRRVKCPICHDWILADSEHWDICPYCGGSGRKQHGYRHDHDHNHHHDNGGSYGNDAAMDPFMRYLTQEEYWNYLYCMQMAFDAKEQVVCPDCGGRQVCRACGGSGLSPIQNPYADFYVPNPCPVCWGNRNCRTCAGLGWIMQDSEQLRQYARDQLAYYGNLVAQRQQQQNNPW